MRELFWNMYQDIAFKKYYYEEHQRRSARLLFIARAVCAVVSISSAVAWSISRSLPLLWALLIALAQITQTLLNDLPWSEQLACLRYLVPDLSKLLSNIDRDWMAQDFLGETDEALIMKIHDYDARFYELEEKYTAGVWFPVVNSVVNAAQKAADNRMDLRYNDWKSEEHADV